MRPVYTLLPRLIAFAIIFLTSFHLLLPSSRLWAAVQWTETTDTDFADGIFNMTITSGTGTAAQLTLSPFGNGSDGNVTVSATKNINTDIITGGRSYADGVNFAVTGVWISSITCSAAPNGIVAGDEVILINMQGCTTDYGNVGNYEFLRAQSVSGSNVIFNSNILKIYGSTHTNTNSNLMNQKIAVQRIPNWGNVTVSGAGTQLTCSAWDGTKGGMVVFRSTGTVSVASGASVDVSTKGFRGGVAGNNGPEDARNPNIVTGGANGVVGANQSAGGAGGGSGSGGAGGTAAYAGGAGGRAGGGGGSSNDANGYGTHGSGGGGAAPYNSGGNYSTGSLMMMGGGSASGGGGGRGGRNANIDSGYVAANANGQGGYGVSGNYGRGGNGNSNAGGGIIILYCNTLAGSGALKAIGGKGGSGGGGGGGCGYDGAAGGGGGGGADGAAGGSVSVKYNSSSWSGTSNVSGGDGGGGGGGGGGDGGGSGGGGGGGIGGGGGGGGYRTGGATPAVGNSDGGNAGAQGADAPSDGGTTLGGGVNGGGGNSGNGTTRSIANQGGFGSGGGNLDGNSGVNANGGAGGSGGAANAIHGGGGGGGQAGNIGANGYINLASTGIIHYCFPATYRSNVLNTNSTDTRVSTITWNPTTQPGGTSILVGVRASNTSFAASDATPVWTPVANGTDPNITGQYIQYISTFTTTSSTTTPRVEDISIIYVSLPNSPTINRISALSPASIEWGWQDNSSGVSQESEFRIYSSTGGLLTTRSADTTFWIETGLSRNKEYARYVQSYNTAGSSNSQTAIWRTKPGTFQSKSSQGSPTRTGANAFGSVGDAAWSWQIPVKSGSALTITAYIRYNSQYGGAATKPKLTLSGKGISPTSVSATAAAEDAWELLTINAGTPTENAILNLKAEGFSTTPGARFYVDDIAVSQ